MGGPQLLSAQAGAIVPCLGNLNKCGGLDPGAVRVDAEQKDAYIGVRDLVARGYFIPGGASQRGVGRAPAFRVARCQTWTILDSGQSPMMSHRDGF